MNNIMDLRYTKYRISNVYLIHMIRIRFLLGKNQNI